MYPWLTCHDYILTKIPKYRKPDPKGFFSCNTGMSSPYLLQNHSIWKSLEDYRERYTGELPGEKKIISRIDQRWVRIPVRLQFIKNRSMGPYPGGGWVHP